MDPAVGDAPPRRRRTPPRRARGSPSRPSGRARAPTGAGSRAPRPRWCCRGCRWARRRRRSPGSSTSARAIATRCCWPPESSLGRWVSRSRRPSVSTTRSKRSLVPDARLRPARSSGSRMFCSAVSIGSRLKDWKTKPTWSRRKTVSAVSSSVSSVDARDRDAAAGRDVEAGQAVHQRGLAGAGGAHDRGEPARGEVEVDATQRVHGGVALAVGCGSGRGRWPRGCRSGMGSGRVVWIMPTTLGRIGRRRSSGRGMVLGPPRG